MKVLIIGAYGQVGHELLRLGDNKKFSIVAPSKTDFDITNDLLVQQSINSINPDIVINAAAYTQVDQAEDEQQKAFAVNRDGVKYLAKACHKKNIPFLHLFTDYIFNGKACAPYIESHQVAPLNVYGQSKWEGEEAIRKHCTKYIILRVSAVFGVHGINFVKTIMRLANERENLKIVSDQTLCPTSACAIAKVLWSLCAMIKLKPAWGTYHFCGDLPTTWYDFAKKIIMETEKTTSVKVKTIEPIATEDYPVKANRPRYSVLDCNLLTNTFGVTAANWQKDLTNVVQQLISERG